MTLLLSALAFIVLITGLILIHELGHFLAARRAGVTVEEFGFGLPPKVKTLFRWGGTAFTFNLIPFGGFVRLRGEGSFDERERRAKGSFGAASIPARIVILVAGVLMNFLLAIVLFFYGFAWGGWVPTYLSMEEMEAAAGRGEITLEVAVLIDDVIAEGPAASADVPSHTLLLAVDGKLVAHPEDVVRLQQGKSRVRYTLKEIGGAGLERDVTVQVQGGKTGVLLAAVPRSVSVPDRSAIEAMRLAFREVHVVTVQTVIGIARLFSSLAQTGTVPEGVTGIVGIAQLTHTSVQEGWGMYLRLVALLSLSLAVLNILPFPALDGGRLLFVIAEWVMRRPAGRRFEMAVNSIGFTVLLLLILLVTFYDVLRLFS